LADGYDCVTNNFGVKDLRIGNVKEDRRYATMSLGIGKECTRIRIALTAIFVVMWSSGGMIHDARMPWNFKPYPFSDVSLVPASGSFRGTGLDESTHRAEFVLIQFVPELRLQLQSTAAVSDDFEPRL
jgi:hypothetical protein